MQNTIVKTHWKTYWKLALFFIIVYLLVNAAFVFIFGFGTIGVVSIAPIAQFRVKKIPNVGGEDFITTSTAVSSGLNMSFMFSIFGIIGITILMITSLTFISLVIMKEIKSGQITIWMTSKLSRNKIILWKIFFIWSVLAAVYLIGFLPVWIITGLAVDFLKYVVHFIIDFIWMYLFILMISSIFIVITVTLVDKGYLSTLLNGLIFAYMIGTWICNYLYRLSPEVFEGLKFVQYISLDSLFVNFFYFKEPNIRKEFEEPGIYYEYGEMLPFNIVNAIILFLSNIAIASLLTYLTTLNFNLKDLRI